MTLRGHGRTTHSKSRQVYFWPGAKFFAEPGVVCFWPGANFFAEPGVVCFWPGANFLADAAVAGVSNKARAAVANMSNRMGSSLVAVRPLNYPPDARFPRRRRSGSQRPIGAREGFYPFHFSRARIE